MRLRLVVLAALAACALFLPALSSAQQGMTYQMTCPSSGFCALAPANNSLLLSNLYNSNGLAGYINAMFQIAISLGAMAAVLRLVWAGYLYMGTDMGWSSKQKATGIIRDTIIGLFLLLAIYLILYQINPNILQLDFLKTDIKPIQPAATQTSQQPVVPLPSGVGDASLVYDQSKIPAGSWCYKSDEPSLSPQYFGCSSTQLDCVQNAREDTNFNSGTCQQY